MKNGNEQDKSLWERETKATKGIPVVGVYYRPPGRVEHADEALFLQLQEESGLQAPVLLTDLNQADICWKNSMISVGNPGFWYQHLYYYFT